MENRNIWLQVHLDTRWKYTFGFLVVNVNFCGTEKCLLENSCLSLICNIYKISKSSLVYCGSLSQKFKSSLHNTFKIHDVLFIVKIKVIPSPCNILLCLGWLLFMYHTLSFYFIDLPWNLINHPKKRRNLILFSFNALFFSYIGALSH